MLKSNLTGRDFLFRSGFHVLSRDPAGLTNATISSLQAVANNASNLLNFENLAWSYTLQDGCW